MTQNVRIEPLSDVAGSVVRPNGGTTIDAVDIDLVKATLRDVGAVVFADFGASLNDFEAFSNQFSDDYMDNTGSASYRKKADQADATIQNVAYVYGRKQQRTFGLPLHADRAYVKSQPEMIWFYCARPANEDGLTFVADGEKIWSQLSDNARGVFEDKPLKYIRNYPDGHWQVAFHTEDEQVMRAYCEENDLTLQVNEDKSVVTEHVKPGFVTRTRFRENTAFVNSILIQVWQEQGLGRRNALVRMGDGSEIPADVLDEVKQVSASLTSTIPWSSGDFAMIDNTRMMHGRTEFSDPEREVYARMCRSVSW